MTGTYPANDYYFVTPGKQVVDQGDGRVDYHLSDKDSLFGSLSWSNAVQAPMARISPDLSTGPHLTARVKSTWPQRTDELYARLEAHPDYGNPRRVYAPGDFAHRRETRAPTCSHSSASADTIRRRPRRTTAGFRKSASATAIRRRARTTGFRRRNTTTSGTSSRTSRLARVRTPINSARNSAPIKFPFFQVPDPHGNIGFSQNETAFPLATKGSNGRGYQYRLTGDSMASALLGIIDSANISTTNFRLLAESRLGQVTRRTTGR